MGYYGNEKADQLAKSVIEKEEFDLEENLPFPISLIKRYCREKALENWQVH